LSTAIHSFEDDALPLLEAMGLSREIMAEVCRRGLAQYLTATPYHPSNAAGLLLYLELVQSLRQELVPVGWETDDVSLALTLNEELGIAIAVRSGDVHTGEPKRIPSFKYPESTTMHNAIGSNARQLGLFDGIPSLEAFAAPKRVDFDRFQTWWLLHHVDVGRSEMRAELSLPINIGANGEANEWKLRIILDSIPFDEEPRIDPAGGDPGSTDFDVPVRKKF
jgi:hypothetical protein